MSEAHDQTGQNNAENFNLDFGHEIEMEDAGFAFRPIEGFELEIDESIYMYSEGGNVEIFMLGGLIEGDVSIAELNDSLAADFMRNVGEYDLVEAGKDTIQGITGFMDDIHFSNADEEGGGKALICSPYINQYFFILVVTSADYWQKEGHQLFDAVKDQVHFHPLLTQNNDEKIIQKHPDLTLETYQDILPDEDFLLTIEKGDSSFLLAARTFTADEQVAITEIVGPGEQQLYTYDPQSGQFSSSIAPQPLISTKGEVVFVYPNGDQQSLRHGDYRFNFATQDGSPLQEVQIIIRTSRALELQKLDLNFWFASHDPRLLEPDYPEQFVKQISKVLEPKLSPLNLAPGKVAYFHPTQEELENFASVDIENDLADCSYMIAESVENNRALNIGLVEHLLQGTAPDISEIPAVSCGSPGMIMAPSSPHACILINWSFFQENLEQMAEAIIQQMVVFSGVNPLGLNQQDQSEVQALNREVAWRLRRHPLFYDAE